MIEFIMWTAVIGLVSMLWRDQSRAFRRQELDAQSATSRQSKFLSAVLGRPFSALSPSEVERVLLLERQGILFRERFGSRRIRLRRKLVPTWRHAVKITETVERDKAHGAAMLAKAKRNDPKPAPEVNCRCGLPHA